MNIGRSPAWAFAAPALGLLAAVLALGCMGEEGPDYEIPAGMRIWSSSLETDADGSPFVFAEVVMLYAAPPSAQGKDVPIAPRNIQSILYAKGSGGWTAHSFRNLQRPYLPESRLLRDADGRIHPLIRDFQRLVLHSRRGNDWVATASFDTDGGMFGDGLASGYLGSKQIAMFGETGLQMVAVSYTGGHGNRIEVRRSDGDHMLLDTAGGGMGGDLFQEKGYQYLIRWTQPGPWDSSQVPQLHCYRWESGPGYRGLRKQILPAWGRPGTRMGTPPGFSFTARIAGETRLFHPQGPDTLEEYALRGDSLAYVGYRAFPASPGQPPVKWGEIEGLSVSPQDCLHGLKPVRKTGDGPVPIDTISFYVHRSSCEEGQDTLRLPEPGPAILSAGISAIRWAPDGSPMVSLYLSRNSYDGFYQAGPPVPSPSTWLYFGKRGAQREWSWEKIAEF